MQSLCHSSVKITRYFLFLCTAQRVLHTLQKSFVHFILIQTHNFCIIILDDVIIYFVHNKKGVDV